MYGILFVMMLRAPRRTSRVGLMGYFLLKILAIYLLLLGVAAAGLHRRNWYMHARAFVAADWLVKAVAVADNHV